MRKTFALLFATFAMMALLAGIISAAPASLTQKPFGHAPDGKLVTLYTLTNSQGMEVRIMNYGGIIQSLKVPDRTGKMDDVVLGYDSLGKYVKASPYFGALVGRYANRIALGQFVLDGVSYSLAVNNGPNSLHGGLKGFDKKVWTSTPMAVPNGVSLTLKYFSKDGEENYPGNLSVKVVYTLTNDNALKIDYTARTDKDTVLNLTNHSYFNLNGAGNGNILGHYMMLNAPQYTPVDKTLIPIGQIRSVSGGPFDFRHATRIGARIKQDNQQLKFANGYDQNFVLAPHGNSLILAARAYSPQSGRVLTVYTTQPGIQFYSGNFLDGTNIGKGGKPYKFRYGFALETQHFPDSPNQPQFPTTELKPGQVYHQVTIDKFSVQK